MALRNILVEDEENEFLRKVSREVKNVDDRIRGILDDMLETMYDDSGVGLAAVQVGILRRLVVIDVTPILKEEIEIIDQKMEKELGGRNDEQEKARLADEKAEKERMLAYGVLKLVNPVIVESEGEERDMEGCLSMPGLQGLVKRPRWVRVRSLDEYGNEKEYTATGILKKAFCHELDHLDGILYRDRADEMYVITDDGLVPENK